MMLDKPVAPRAITMEEKGNLTYYGSWAGCHAYDIRMIGPPINVIQAIYKNNAQGGWPILLPHQPIGEKIILKCHLKTTCLLKPDWQ